jgi:hypothetical protein
MRSGLLLVVAALVVSAVVTPLSARPKVRGAPPPPPPEERWMDPPRKPLDCAWYRSADPKHWSKEEKERSERECRLREEFRAFVTARQSCSHDDDCALVRVVCPFGCEAVPVNKAQVTAVAAKHEELAKKLETPCKWKCQPVSRTACDKGWCVAAR